MCLLREVRVFDGESLDLHDYSLKGCDLDSNTPERAVVIYRYETALQTQSVHHSFIISVLILLQKNSKQSK